MVPWFAGPAPYDGRSRTVQVIFGSARTLTIAAFVLGALLFFPVLGMVALAIPAIVISMAYYKHAQTQQYAMLALIATAASARAPLEPIVVAFGNERGGWMRERTKQMARMLLDGVPLPVAAEKVPGVVPPEAVPLVRVGHDTGALAAAIDQAITAHDLIEPVWQTIVPKIAYLCLLPSVAVGIIIFIMLKIVPQFQKIFKDFGMRLPDITRGLISAANFAGAWWFLLAPVWLLTIALFFSACRAMPAGFAGTHRAWHG